MANDHRERDTLLDSAVARAPLVVRFGAFGDTVLLTVLLRHLYERFGRRVDVVSSGPWTVPLLAGQPWVARVHTIRSRRTPYWLSIDQRRLVRWLRERGAGPTWFCEPAVGSALLSRGGVPDRFIVDYRALKSRRGETLADRYVRLGNETPVAFEGRIPPPRAAASRQATIVLDAEARERANAWLSCRGLGGRPFVVVQPGSAHVARRERTLRPRTGAAKYWPEARWAAVLRAVRELRPDHAIVMTGTSVERRFNEDILSRAGVLDAHDTAGELPLDILLPVLERARSMISVDTGPAHAAAALGCPTVALFGDENPVFYRPGGTTTPATALTGTVNGRRSILAITVDDVIAAWLDLIGGPPPGGDERRRPGSVEPAADRSAGFAEAELREGSGIDRGRDAERAEHPGNPERG